MSWNIGLYIETRCREDDPWKIAVPKCLDFMFEESIPTDESNDAAVIDQYHQVDPDKLSLWIRQAVGYKKKTGLSPDYTIRTVDFDEFCDQCKDVILDYERSRESVLKALGMKTANTDSTFVWCAPRKRGKPQSLDTSTMTYPVNKELLSELVSKEQLADTAKDTLSYLRGIRNSACTGPFVRLVLVGH